MKRSIQERAKAALADIEAGRQDPRFRRTIARLVQAGLLSTNLSDLPPARGRLRLADALFAGTVEPRVYELLPALVLKRPRLLALPKTLPADLADVVERIRYGRPLPDFRGVPAELYLPWVDRLGRSGRGPSIMRSFRLRPEDLARLRELQVALGADSETEVLRRALAALHEATSSADP